MIREFVHMVGLHGDLWAIEPTRLRAMVTAFVSQTDVDHESKACPRKIELYSLDGDPVAAVREMDAIADTSQRQTRPAIAVMSLSGPITHRASAFTSFFGGTSVAKWQQAFAELVANPAIAGIVIDTDSPGGSVAGIAELATVVRAARSKKPIVAVANTWAASAAYHVISQASEIAVTHSGEVGSIGVYSLHMNFSEALKQDGIEATFIHAGDFKIEANPYQPLGEEARDELQRGVDHYYEIFVDDVAKGRKTTSARVKSTFGRGRMVRSLDAVEVGMADYVATFDQTIRRLGASIKETARVKAEREARERELELLEATLDIS